MLINISPLIRYRDYRLLFIGQLVSIFGSMMTYVALPYQIYHLTGSSLAVGLIGIAELVPLLFTALIGGAYSDALDRRKLLIITEVTLALCSAGLAINSMLSHPRVWVLYVIAAMISGITGFHRPANRAMTPRLVDKIDIPAATALESFKDTLSSVAGPAVGGILIATVGLTANYFIDVCTFVFSLLALLLMKPMPASEKSTPATLKSIKEGLKYAWGREELIGTYVVDFVAMVFGMPTALFPAVAEHFGGAWVLGWLYSAPAVGALVASTFSGWTLKVRRHGAGVILAALFWGLAIVAFGFSKNIWCALFFLGLAGSADMVSSIFRNTIWNGTIPDHLRGRLAGVEMISYMSGPLLGNTESGLVAAISSTQISIASGGALCVVGVLILAFRLPKFWNYEKLD